MANSDSVSEDKWYENIIIAAKHLALSNYETGRPNSRFRVAHSGVAVTLATAESEFVRNRGGTLVVDISQDRQYGVLVETNNGLTSIRLREMLP